MTAGHPIAPPLQLFQAYGVELEYMIVDAQDLAVRPIADTVLHQVAGEYLSEVELGDIAWSNELALHVIELKTNGPASSLAPLTARFQEHVGRINAILQPLDARLMPTAMHPWMDPFRELKLWPHEHNPIYETYNRIFDCRGHGWANLQSVHLNLPFADDQQFARLHAAIRLLMPLMPALAASSPVVERRVTGLADNRLEVYRQNSRSIPSITADVIPEPVFTRADYEREIFHRMYHDIAALDPDGVLRHEWLNARGAIARFDRNTIEIRVLDVQECPAADLAICAALAAVLEALSQERWTSIGEQQSLGVAPLLKILLATIGQAEQAIIEDAVYLAQFGLSQSRIAARDLWQHLIEAVDVAPFLRLAAGEASPERPAWKATPLETILRQGTLSSRIRRALSRDQQPLPEVYGRLCDCLARGTMFDCP